MTLVNSVGYRVHHGILVDRQGEVVDEVLATVFRAPNSYTGEDVVEISCHGGIVVTAGVLKTILDAGARAAEPGEFTRRAFLNGKIDLARAEAVAEVISSRSASGLRSSLEQLQGKLSGVVSGLRSELVDLRGLLELELDFSEEGIELVQKDHLISRIQNATHQMQDLIGSYEQGRVYRDGVTVAILGKPNAGKSSLFNSLLQSDRAIVSPIPGTTRDHIEEEIQLDGVRFRLTDTAGLREGAEEIEAAGIRRSIQVADRSDIILHVVDVTVSETVPQGEPRKIIVLNKADLINGSAVPRGGILVSSLTGFGLSELRKAICSAAIQSHSAIASTIVTSQRHVRALVEAVDFLRAAARSINRGDPGEVTALELRSATDSLDQITGAITTDEILDGVFGRFCIGK